MGEFMEVIDGQPPMQHLLQAHRAGAGIHDHWVKTAFAVIGGLQQGIDERIGDRVGFVGQAFAGQHLAATQSIEALRQARCVACAHQQLLDDLGQRGFIRLVGAENPATAGREIDHRIALATVADDRLASPRHAGLPGAARQTRQYRVAKHIGRQVSGPQPESRQGRDLAEIAGRPLPDLARNRPDAAAAQQARQFAGVDANRASGRTQAATRAGIQPHIGKISRDVVCFLTRCGAA